MIEIGKSDSGAVYFDIPSLIETRLLIQSSSGGGKSYAIRRLLEQSHGKIQQIVLDLEGEFSTLREKYDYIIAGKNGDTAATPATAKLLARRILELGVSTICDLYELKYHERIQFVRYFLESIMAVPRDLWHPVLIVIDECHHFCPEKGQAESHQAVIDLATRGRKRGFSAILATQRLSKLHKDACAELLNKMIGRTSLDIDQVRAADELGLIGKESRIALRNLEPGEFHVYGPAVRLKGQASKGVSMVKVGSVNSRHPKVGARQLEAPPKPTAKIREILGKLADLPAEAAKQERDLQTAEKQISDLRGQLKRLEGQTGAPAACSHGPEILNLKDEIRHLRAAAETAKSILSNIRSIALDDLGKLHEKIIGQIDIYDKSKSEYIPKEIPKPPNEGTRSRPASSIPTNVVAAAPGNFNLSQNSGDRRMLIALAGRHPMKTTISQLATLSGIKKTGGTFGTYFSRLKNAGFIQKNGNEVSITPEGFAYLGMEGWRPQTLEETRAGWRERLSGSAKTMFDLLENWYPSWISKRELAERVGIEYSGGTWGTYFSSLKSNDLIEINGEMIRLNQTLMGEDN